MQYGFQQNPRGLYVPSPAGLAGFQRQGMEQRKKGSAGAISFRASSAGLAAAVTKPTGVSVGDVVFVVHGGDGGAAITALTTAGGGRVWNRSQISWVTPGYTSVAFWQILDNVDVANAWNFTGGTPDWLCDAYAGNGATLVTLKATDNSPSAPRASLPLGPFAASAASRGVYAALTNRDTPITFLPPTGFLQRQKATKSTFWDVATFDMLTGFSRLYTAAVAPTWTEGTLNGEAGWIWEAT